MSWEFSEGVLAEREGFELFYNKGVNYDLSEDTPETDVVFVHKWHAICSCALTKLYPTWKSQSPNGQEQAGPRDTCHVVR